MKLSRAWPGRPQFVGLLICVMGTLCPFAVSAEHETISTQDEVAWDWKDSVLPREEPRIECDGAMLERSRNRIQSNEEPFASYWNATRADRGVAIETVPSPYTGRDALKYHGAAQEQGTAARLLAYEWHLEGNEDAGTHAIELLDAWSTASPKPGTNLDPEIRFPNAGMDVARGTLPFIAAYDLLATHPTLTNEKRQRIDAWFRALVSVIKEGIKRWEANDDFGGQHFQNHHVAHVMGLVLVAAVLDDDALLRYAVDSPENPKDYHELVDGLILMPDDDPIGGRRGKTIFPGELQDRVRTGTGDGTTYCHLSLTMMLYTAEVLTRVTGTDYINYSGSGGENLRDVATFYSDFFRLRNAHIKNGYYFRDHKWIQNNRPFYGTFEVALSHWPDVPNLKAIVRSADRASTPRWWGCYYGLPVLTHGVERP